MIGRNEALDSPLFAPVTSTRVEDEEQHCDDGGRQVGDRNGANAIQ
jgi:hypothetical protein